MSGFWRSASRSQWFTLTGSWASWLFDAMDAGLYAFVIAYLVKDFGNTLPEVVSVVSIFLIATAVGGVLLGNLCDRIGRKKTMLFSVFCYGLFTLLAGTAQNLTQMAVYRFLVGIAVGGLWPAAAALISELWAPEHRAKAIAFMQTGWAGGNLLAALFAMLFLPVFGWRGLFYVASIPAWITFIYVLFAVQESPIWLKNRHQTVKRNNVEFFEIFKPQFLKTTLIGLLVSILGMFGYWILFTFLPTYLDNTLKLGIAKSASFLVWTGLGAMVGYIFFGVLSDRYGRRPIFSLFFAGMAAMVPIFTWTVTSHGITYLVPASLFLGFFTGYFSGYGAWYSELYPTRLRATASGFLFNAGRAAIFIGPVVVAKLIPVVGFTMAISTAAVGYFLAAFLVFILQETKGRDLTAIPESNAQPADALLAGTLSKEN